MTVSRKTEDVTVHMKEGCGPAKLARFYYRDVG